MSKNDMVMVPRELLERVVISATRADVTRQLDINEMQRVLDKPVDKHHSDPVAWFRDGDDGREYCEKPFTTDWKPLYTHSDPGDAGPDAAQFSAGDMATQGARAFASRDAEVERLREACAKEFASVEKLSAEVERLRVENKDYREGAERYEDLCEAQSNEIRVLCALLARSAKLARGMVVHPWADKFASLAADIERIGVSASAEPSALVETLCASELGFHAATGKCSTNDITEHVKGLGITYFKFLVDRMGDCLWFFNCRNVPANLPEWLERKQVSAADWVGRGGMTEEIAREIEGDASRVHAQESKSHDWVERAAFEAWWDEARILHDRRYLLAARAAWFARAAMERKP